MLMLMLMLLRSLHLWTHLRVRQWGVARHSVACSNARRRDEEEVRNASPCSSSDQLPSCAIVPHCHCHLLHCHCHCHCHGPLGIAHLGIDTAATLAKMRGSALPFTPSRAPTTALTAVSVGRVYKIVVAAAAAAVGNAENAEDAEDAVIVENAVVAAAVTLDASADTMAVAILRGSCMSFVLSPRLLARQRNAHRQSGRRYRLADRRRHLFDCR